MRSTRPRKPLVPRWLGGLLLAALGAPATGAADFARLPDGRLQPGCDYLSDAPSPASKMEFVGGLQFADGPPPARPRDAAAAVAALEVGPLRLSGDPRRFDFLDKREEPDGFAVRWADPAQPATRVTLYTSWASLKDPARRKRNVLCRESAPAEPAR